MTTNHEVGSSNLPGRARETRYLRKRISMSQEQDKNKTSNQTEGPVDDTSNTSDIQTDQTNAETSGLELEIEAESLDQEMPAEGDDFGALADKYADDEYDVALEEGLEVFEDPVMPEPSIAQAAPQKKRALNPNITRNIVFIVLIIGLGFAGFKFLNPLGLIQSFTQEADSQTQTPLLSYQSDTLQTPETDSVVPEITDQEILASTETLDVEPIDVTDELVATPPEQDLEDLFTDKPEDEGFPEIEDIELTDVFSSEPALNDPFNDAPSALGEDEVNDSVEEIAADDNKPAETLEDALEDVFADNPVDADPIDETVETIDNNLENLVEAPIQNAVNTVEETIQIATPREEGPVNEVIETSTTDFPALPSIDESIEDSIEAQISEAEDLVQPDEPSLSLEEEVVEVVEAIAPKVEEAKPAVVETPVASRRVVIPKPDSKPALRKSVSEQTLEKLETEAQISSKRIAAATESEPQSRVIKKVEDKEIELSKKVEVTLRDNEAAYFERQEKEKIDVETFTPTITARQLNRQDKDTSVSTEAVFALPERAPQNLVASTINDRKRFSEKNVTPPSVPVEPVVKDTIASIAPTELSSSEAINEPQSLRVIKEAAQPLNAVNYKLPSNAELFEKANQYRARGLYETAKQSYYFLLDDDPTNLSVLTQLVDMASERSVSEGLKEIAFVKSNYGESSAVLIQEGILLAKNSNQNKAISTLSRAVSLDPTNPIALYNLGLMYDRAGNAVKALEAYKSAIANAGDESIIPVSNIRKRMTALRQR